MKRDVVVVIGAGGIGGAIARRQGFGKTLLLADCNEKTLQSAAEDLRGASYAVETHFVDVSSRESVRSLARRQYWNARTEPVVPLAYLGGASAHFRYRSVT